MRSPPCSPQPSRHPGQPSSGEPSEGCSRTLPRIRHLFGLAAIAAAVQFSNLPSANAQTTAVGPSGGSNAGTTGGFILSADGLSPKVSPEVSETALLISAGQLEKARRTIAQRLQERPRDPQWRFLRGVLAAQEGQTENAVVEFESLTQAFPELAEPYNNLAVLHLKQGRVREAREALERAILNRPDYGLAYENLGDLYTRLAQEAYSDAARRKGSTAYAPAKRDHLRSVPSAPKQATAPKQPTAQR